MLGTSVLSMVLAVLHGRWQASLVKTFLRQVDWQAPTMDCIPGRLNCAACLVLKVENLFNTLPKYYESVCSNCISIKAERNIKETAFSNGVIRSVFISAPESVKACINALYPDLSIHNISSVLIGTKTAHSTYQSLLQIL